MIPYAAIAGVVLARSLLFAFTRMPDTGREKEQIRLVPLLKHSSGTSTTSAE
jgi:hypothetical protein